MVNEQMIGTAIFVRTYEGDVLMRGAYSYPWNNNLHVRAWMNPPGAAGVCGLHTELYDDDKRIFSVEGGCGVADAFAGPHLFSFRK